MIILRPEQLGQVRRKRRTTSIARVSGDEDTHWRDDLDTLANQLDLSVGVLGNSRKTLLNALDLL